MTEHTPQTTHHTQARRRLKYGLNVAVAVLAAAVLVVFVNWIAYRHLYQRLDLTAGQRYSLAQQTTQLLNNLKGDHEIIALMRVHNERRERVLSLLREYERYSDQLTVTHIDPNRDIAQRDRFYERLLDRHADELAPVREAVEAHGKQVAEIFDELAAMAAPLQRAMEHPELDNPQLASQLQQLLAWVGQSDSTALNDSLAQSLDAPLPAYNEALATLSQPLDSIDRNLQTAVQWFQGAVNRQGVPNAVKEQLLTLAQQAEPLRQRTQDMLRELESVDVPATYQRLRRDLGSSESVMVMNDQRMRTVPVSELYRDVDPRLVRQEGEPATQFLTEEKITGALLSLRLEQPPLVVFVYTGQQPPLGERGSHTQVAERLRSANFEVTQWNPTGGGQPGPMGGMQGGGPSAPPEPREGQRAVWILLHARPQNPMMAMTASDGEQTIVDHLNERLAAGDSALVMLGMDLTGGMGGASPLRQMVETWGVTPLVDRQILREVRRGQGTPQPVSSHIVTDWPDALPVTRALDGLSAVFIESSPLTLRNPDDMDVEHWPLVKLRGDRMWAERASAGDDNIEYDESDAAETFTVAVAAESDAKRLIVTTDPRWPSDRLTNLGYEGLPAALTGVQFPGNSELFVNSVYWLAGLEQMIAASPRTQDIRRIEAMTDTKLIVYRWSLLVGMPAVVLVLGMGVWLVRRRG